MKPKIRPQENDARGADPSAYPGMPRWVKVFGIIAIALVLLVLFVILSGIGGPHGPGRHLPSSGSPDAHAPTETSPR
jgi:hypothetical protein